MKHTAHGLPPVHILLVDDDEDEYLLIHDMFSEIEEIPFELEWVSSCDAALEVIRRRPHDAYLLDYYLGERTGLDLLHEMIAVGCPGPIIMLTGQESRALDLAAMDAGATDYLVKSRLNPYLLERSIRYSVVHKQVEGALREAHDELEQRVRDRTVALSVVNEMLQLEIAQRKEAEQVMRQNEAKRRALLDAIPDAMIKVRRDGTVLEYKPPHDFRLVLLPSWCVHKKIGEVLPVSLANLMAENVEQALHVQDLQTFEYRLPGDEEGHHIEVCVVVSGQDEALCILRDITERRKAERIQAEFLSVVSHELRTPLTSISGSLALLAVGIAGELPERAGTMVDVAHRNSERLIRLINDLLDLQKIESGTIPLHLEPVDVGALVARAVEANQAYGERYTVSFVYDEGCPEAWVHGDPDRLMQVLTNLLSNAAKFSLPHSTVAIAVTQHDKGIRVSVTDEGPGIPPEYLGHVFKKFAQVDSSSSRQIEGTGLGLSISRAIVDMHGGRIDFDTEVGTGTTFYFDLPEWHCSLGDRAGQDREPGVRLVVPPNRPASGEPRARVPTK